MQWTDHPFEPQCRLPSGRLAWISITTERVWVYSDGEYLGTQPTVQAGKAMAITGKKGNYVMELETTEEAWAALKPKPKKWEWKPTDKKDEWSSVVEGEKLPVRIRMLDKKTWVVYRDGTCLGAEVTRELAEKRAQIGRVSQKNSLMRLWERDHPNELPPFVQLTQEERDEYWRRNPPVRRQAAALGTGAAPKVPRVAGGGDPAADARPAKAAKQPRAAKATADVPKGVITVLNGANPKKAGSGAAKRWDTLFSFGGKTVAEYQAAGHNMDTLANAMAKGNIKVEDK